MPLLLVYPNQNSNKPDNADSDKKYNNNINNIKR